ncbi:AAA family ATPase [Nocardia terpenica]|uniref:ATP-binding protein n=1 Tax=Nocardia terpenica TaxID=455432 RepID=A0A164JD77_9NOCA|nr:AAA family ATPase [Nocardia terpenica]KZM70287.1 ATP-binding protein [Nocardia terpenica]NQE91385.1 AAA family ATPase [Nocardia terpenica]
MMLTLAVENYRSLRDLVMPLTRLNIVTGANGSGKSSLYRALRLLADAARNGAVGALAREGGLPSTLWAGPQAVTRPAGTGRITIGRSGEPVGLRLGFGGDDFGYAIDLGMPGDGDPEGMFGLDPEIKREVVWGGPVLRLSTVLVDRHNGVVTLGRGHRATRGYPIRLFDSMLTEFPDPQVAPELWRVREQLRSWRFYDHFRTDASAPARIPRIGTRTTVLGSDGGDLAAAIQTIREIGDRELLNMAVDNAFPGSRVDVTEYNGRFELRLHQPGLLRPLTAAELSDGTLRYLLLVAALLTPRPPELMVLNEPETSLHPDLLAPLGSLIATAAQHSQLIVVSHAHTLIAAAEAAAAELDIDTTAIELVKNDGETLIEGQKFLDRPPWFWPER